MFCNCIHQFFSKKTRFPQRSEITTFSEYIVSLYQEIEYEMREKLEGRKENIVSMV